MGVYIKGMEMPTSCYDCPVECEGDICGITKGGCTWDIRPPHCPLAAIPPHGRLVEMDEIKKRIASCCSDIDCYKIMCDECAVQIVMNKVKAAPTIIPADKGGDT